LKRELKVLEIVKREAFEAPIRSFFSQKEKKTTHPMRKFSLFSCGYKLRFWWILLGESYSLILGRRGGKGEGQTFFFFSSLLKLVWHTKIIVVSRMGALFFWIYFNKVSQHQFFHFYHWQDKVHGLTKK